MSTLQQAKKLSETVELLDQLAANIRRRAAQDLGTNTINAEQYFKIDDHCDAVSAAARRLDGKVLKLVLDGLDEPLSRIAEQTTRLKEASAAIERVRNVVEVSTKLLLVGLAVAAMVVDPTRISAIAAARAIAGLVETITELATEEE